MTDRKAACVFGCSLLIEGSDRNGGDGTDVFVSMIEAVFIELCESNLSGVDESSIFVCELAIGYEDMECETSAEVLCCIPVLEEGNKTGT